MDTNVYNIIWADDQIDEILDDNLLAILNSKHFNVVATAHDGRELEFALRNCRNQIDAVIVDANFNESSQDVFSERDTSGLNYARGLYLHELKKKIPFFVLTNRSDELLREIYKDSPSILTEDFPLGKRRFSKSDSLKDRILPAISKTIEESQSPEFLIRNKYRREFIAANLIPGATELLFRCLLHEEANEEDYEDTQHYFNPLRMIWEKIECECKSKNLLPPISKLNSMADFLLGKSEVEGYKLTKEIMPKALAHSLKYFLTITQDGSHSRDDLKLKVIEYARSRKNSNLYRTVLYITLDLLLWYEDYSKNYLVGDMWETSYILKDIVKSTVISLEDGRQAKRYYVGRYSLIPHKDANGNLIPLHEGDLVGVVSDQKSRENNPKYLGEDGTEVDKTLADYVII